MHRTQRTKRTQDTQPTIETNAEQRTQDTPLTMTTPASAKQSHTPTAKRDALQKSQVTGRFPQPSWAALKMFALTAHGAKPPHKPKPRCTRGARAAAAAAADRRLNARRRPICESELRPRPATTGPTYCKRLMRRRAADA